MKKQNRKGFTIVELVIVIAVIAILSAVLIPTFGSIIENANRSVDTQLAASATTELIIYLEGDTIDNEAELVEALEKSGVGEKLVPQNTSGANFWFNVETQTIEVIELDKVKSVGRNNAANANTSFRDLYNKNLYLVDYDVLADEFSTVDITYNVFSYIDNMATADEYKNLIVKLGEIAEDHRYYEIAVDLLAKLHNTTIKTEAGSFFSAEGNATKQEYISASASFIGNSYFKYENGNVTEVVQAPAPIGPVVIPDNIEHVVEDSFNYEGDDNKVVVGDTGILSPGFSNSDVVIGDKEYEFDPSVPTEDVLVNKENAEDKIQLTVKLPFEEIVISHASKGAVKSAGDRIYVAFRNGTLQLNVANKKDIAQTSSKVDKWELVGMDNTNGIINEATGLVDFSKIDFGGNSYVELNVKATAKDVNGTPVSAETVVVVAKPRSASMTINTNSGDLTFNSGAASPETLTLLYNGELTSYSVVTSGNYGSDSNGVSIDSILGIVPEITLTHDNFVYDNNDKKLVYKATAVGETAYYTLTVKADNAVDINISLEMADANAAIFTTDFHYDRTSDREYYIGSANAIKLSDLYNASSAFGTGDATSAKVTIYDKGSATGKLFSFNTANNDLDPFDITTYILVDADGNLTDDTATGSFVAKDSITITKENWEKAVIKFSVEEDNNLVNGKLKAYIEIVPSDNTVSTITLFSVVDGAKNVTSISELANSGNEHTTDIVLQADIPTVANSDKVLLGDNTLYGNGYVITATTYKSTAADNVLTDSFISVNGGTVDNIYIDGPVYPVLNYDHNSDKYYVSGISLTGSSTIRNSYVSGFRQPVCSSGSDAVLTMNNTTLRGGNYANLLIKDGNLNLHNVTTIQDQNGMRATVDDTSKYVTGMGIGLEEGALDSKIVITGYLDQYNWVKNGQTAILPSLSTSGVSLNVNNLFSFIFNGIKEKVLVMNVTADMGSVKYFINQAEGMDPNSRTDGYVHAGIVFGKLGSDAASLVESVTIDESGRTDGAIKMRKFERLKLLFSETGLERNGSFLFTAKDYFKTDGLVVIWSHTDNRQWAAASLDYSIGWTGVQVTRLVNPTGTKVVESKPIYKIGDGTDYPINYNGEYKTGAYASYFNK